jgi:hypothetical protein
VQICDVQPGYVQALSAFLPYGKEKDRSLRQLLQELALQCRGLPKAVIFDP